MSYPHIVNEPKTDNVGNPHLTSKKGADLINGPLESPCLRSQEESMGSSTKLTPHTILEPGELEEFAKRPASKLCGHCQNVFDCWLKVINGTERDFQHHKHRAALLKSSLDGCALCAQLYWGSAWTNLKNESQRPMGRVLVKSTKEVNSWWLEEDWRMEDYWELELLVPYVRSEGAEFDEPGAVEEDENSGESRCYLCRVNVVPTLYQGEGPSLRYDAPDSLMSTKDALPLCKYWLRKCRETHEACKASQQNQLPSRLIAISDAEIRLCTSSELEGELEYATLSHCWGSLEFLTLKTDTLDSFRTRIPQGALPKTFRDAIYIARYLGFQYLWIDSLCIIQDDVDDWERESALMTSVYNNSALNIAASAAADGSAGCFWKRKSIWRCQIRTSLSGKDVFYDCFPFDDLWSRQKSQPLSARGWVVQERFLSRQALHFTDAQVFWECGERPACEMFPHEYPYGTPCLYVMEKWPMTQAMWPYVVSQYSACNLSMSRDKLVAIAGLAQLIQTQTGDVYVAGLWRNDLERQLCWYSDGGGGRITPYRAPTWSWASMKSAVVPQQEEEARQLARLYIRVHSLDIKPASANPFGEIRSASLRLGCDYLLKGNGFRHGEGVLELAGKSIPVSAKFDSWKDDKVRLVRVHILPIQGQQISETSPSYFAEGLLLEPTGLRKGQYQRIGCFYFLKKEGALEFEMTFDQAKCQAEEWEYAEISIDRDGSQQKLIDLI